MTKNYPKHQVIFHWIKGHADNYYNERCDELAVAVAESNNLLIDAGCEQNASSVVS